MATKAIDKWKTKKWFEVTAPALFREKVIGETFATNPNVVADRIVEVDLSAVMQSESRRPKTKLRFRINELKGMKATTIFLGHRIVRDFERTLVRRRTSKIYVNERVNTKDGKAMNVKAFVITLATVTQAYKKDLRLKLSEEIQSYAKATDFEPFIFDILTDKLSRTLKSSISKVYPLRYAVIQKTEIL